MPLHVFCCAFCTKTESERRKHCESHVGPKPPAGSYQIQLLHGGPSAALQAASHALCEAMGVRFGIEGAIVPAVKARKP